jgi:GTP-binding protein TrmE-like protein
MPYTRPMLRPSCSLLPALRRTRYISAYSPTHRALPLSDAQRNTIYALSTAPAKSGVAIIRVSGTDALHVWRRMVRSTIATHIDQDQDECKHKRTRGSDREHGRNNETRPQQLPPEAWKLQRCHVVDPQTSELLDNALAVFFRGAPPPPSPLSPKLNLISAFPSHAIPILSPPLLHYRGRTRTTPTWRTRRHQCSAYRARAHSGVSPRCTGRVYAPRVRGRSP